MIKGVLSLVYNDKKVYYRWNIMIKGVLSLDYKHKRCTIVGL